MQKRLGNLISKIILYGLYARSDYREDSDIDIMILTSLQDKRKIDLCRYRLANSVDSLKVAQDCLEKFLVPFYIFSHESRFEEYNKDEDKLNNLKKEYADIVYRLERLMETGNAF